MSTRSLIGIITEMGENPDNPAIWEGVYHHFDGYPTGLGASLWQHYHQHYAGALPAMLEYLLSERVGWSSINGCDLSLPPIWVEGFGDNQKIVALPHIMARLEELEPVWRASWPDAGPDGFKKHIIENAPQSYTQRGETVREGRHDEHTRSTDSDLGWVEYAYLFDLDERNMHIFDVRYDKLYPLSIVDLDGDEPDWSVIEEQESDND